MCQAKKFLVEIAEASFFFFFSSLVLLYSIQDFESSPTTNTSWWWSLFSHIRAVSSFSFRDGFIFSSPSSKGGRDHPCFTATPLTISTGLFENCCSFDLFLLFFILVKLWQQVGPDGEWTDQGPPRRAKWWYSTFHTVTAMIGAGVLSLPYAMAYLGWYIYTKTQFYKLD